jgi:membrane-associated protein
LPGLELLASFIDIVLHLDKHLQVLVQNHGAWVYLILFAIVFCETGLVVTPFLPGDSLLFVAGALAAAGGMNVHLLVVLLIIAAIAGDAVNYAVGRYLGPKVFHDDGSRFLNRGYLEKAHEFYERHGGKTIIIARFIPIIRTYAPFVAGIGSMPYPRFAMFNVVGAVIWVVSLAYAGFFFGNIPWVKSNLSLVIITIIILSILPAIAEVLRQKLSKPAKPV